MITVFEIVEGDATLRTHYELHQEPRVGSTLIGEDDRVLEVRSMHTSPSSLGEPHVVLHVSLIHAKARVQNPVSHRVGLSSKTDVPDTRARAGKPVRDKAPRFLGEKIGR